jgi:glycosyltransferase involved in cell wall biosynthesis
MSKWRSATDPGEAPHKALKKNYHIAIVSPQVVGIGQTPQTYSSQQINLARCWADAGHRVDVITGKCDGLAQALSHDRVRLYEQPVLWLGGAFGMPVMLGGWSRLALTKYDMVFSSEHYQPATFLSCLLSKNVVIYQGQNTAGSTVFKRFAVRGMETIFGPLVRQRYRKVVTKTQAAEAFVRKRGFEKAVTIPCGYDANRYRMPSADERRFSRDHLGFNDNDLVLVYAGNLLARRNVGAALKACAMLRSDGLDAHLVVVGKGPELGRLKQLAAEIGFSHAVHFKGHLDWMDLRKVYWAGDIFVFPTRYEIFGLVLMEALACGLRIVSTPCPAATDILLACPDVGICVPVDDSCAIADACNQLFLSCHLKVSTLKFDWIADNSWEGISHQIIQTIF